MKFKVGDRVRSKQPGQEYTGTVTKIETEIIIVKRDDASSGWYCKIVGDKVATAFGSWDGKSYLELESKTLETLQVGDIVVDEFKSEHYVMGVAGKMIWISDDEKESEGYFRTSYYTLLELKNNGFKVKSSEPEVTEVTMDEIAKKFGVSVESLKVKKE